MIGYRKNFKMSTNTAIHLKNITKEYPGVIANKNVDFEVNKEKFML